MTDHALPKAKVVRPKVNRKAKGKAVDANQEAGPARNTEIVDQAPSGKVNKASGPFSTTGSSATPPPITTIDDNNCMGFTLGQIAHPKSILKRRASDSDITSSAIQA